MKSKKLTPILFILFTAFIITTACVIDLGFSNNNDRQSIYLELTVTAQAQAIQQTAAALNVVQPQTIVIVVTATPGAQEVAPAAPAAATNTAEPAKPEIINSTLCWLGPGDKYEVSSSLSKGQFVELLGRGDTSGWIIVLNPIYKEPCWVQAFDIKLDPSIDINSLKVYYAPLPPTKTPKPPTAVPSATNTP